MKIRSKFSFIQVYLLYGFFITILISGVYLVTRSDVMLRTKFGSTMSAAYTGLMFIVLSLSYFYFNQKYLLKIYIRNNMIIIRSLFWQRTYTVSDIQNIDLFARKSLNFLAGQTKSNGISIVTYNQSYFLVGAYYNNMPAIKAALCNSFKPLTDNQVEKKNDISIKSFMYFNTEPEKFSGCYLLSANGIIFTCFCIGMLYITLTTHNKEYPFIKLILLIPISIFYLASGYQSHYFFLSKNHLRIRNQLWWWKSIEYDLKDIQNIIIEKGYKQSNTLRVNTKDFHSRTFQAGGLWSGTWRRFIQQLQTAGIEVKSDSYL